MDMMCQMAMGSWAKLNTIITVFTEEQLQTMLEYEKTHKQRLNMMIRIQQRLNSLEGERKLEALRKEFNNATS